MLVSMKFNCLDSEEGIVIPEKILVNKISHSFCYRYIYDSSRTYPVRSKDILVLRWRVWDKREPAWKLGYFGVN